MNIFLYFNQEHVCRNKHINCTEAAILLAYATYEQAKDVSIYTFSGSVDGDLEEIHPLLKRDNFQHAKQICEQKTVNIFSLLTPNSYVLSNLLEFFLFYSRVNEHTKVCRNQLPQQLK